MAVLLTLNLAAVAAVILAAGRAPLGVAGSALAAVRIDAVDSGGVQITETTQDSPRGPDGNRAVAAVLTDLNSYWMSSMPADFGRAMTPLSGGYQATDSSAAGLSSRSALCISAPAEIAGNAYYCPTGDGIVYDTAALVPVLLGHYGSTGPIAAFAHEFGHSIQARIGPTMADRGAHPADYPSIVIEAQGDCYSGAFLAWVVAGSAPHLHVPRDALVAAVAPLLDFADPASTPVDDPAAHGLAVDRWHSFLIGFRSGAKGCHALVRSSMNPTLGRPGLAPPAATPRYAGQSAVLVAARTRLSAFAADLPGITGTRGAPDRETIARAVASAADVQAAKPFGQFALASAQAMAVGRTLTGTVNGAACFTGAWTASVFGHSPRGTLGAWAGDADEALNMLRTRPAATVDELIGFDDGFARGWVACH